MDSSERRLDLDRRHDDLDVLVTLDDLVALDDLYALDDPVAHDGLNNLAIVAKSFFPKDQGCPDVRRCGFHVAFV